MRGGLGKEGEVSQFNNIWTSFEQERNQCSTKYIRQLWQRSSIFNSTSFSINKDKAVDNLFGLFQAFVIFL